jgi:hypothetical protein
MQQLSRLQADAEYHVSNPNKAKGTAWETKIMEDLREHGYHAHRLALRGGLDEGDIAIPSHPDGELGGQHVIIQAKDVGRLQLSLFCDELIVQMQNAQTSFAAIVAKRRRKGVEEAYVILPWKEFRDAWLPLTQKGASKNT